ncbi:MAG TPA: hypothetical protein VHR35_02380 [Nocardioides sp.]|nr:hypothetical protein [Nocardioides sp.]
MIPAPGTERNRLVATSAGLCLGGLAYFLTLFDYRTSLTRTTLQSGLFSTFYDQQARALLDGHVDLPTNSLGIEGFVHGGRTYMYFPPWPAILRLPVLLTTHEYDGRLTLLSMAIAWIVFAVMVTRLAWFLLPRLSGLDEVSRGTGALVAFFLAAATGGSFLTFDAGQPWVYHEAYVWAVASVVGGLYWLVRLVVEPSRQAAWWVFVFSLLSLGSRATEGWALSIAVLALGLWWRINPRRTETNPLWWRVVLAGALPLAASIALNEYKFGTVYIFPLQEQVWTLLNEHRRVALAVNGGGLTGPQFFATSFMAYLRLDGIRFVDYFPFITLPAHPPPAYAGAFVDQTYRTGSVTAFMPLLMVLFLVSLVLVAWPRTLPELAKLRLPMLVSIMVTGGVMGYGYYSARYSTEFVPAMVLGGAIGTAVLAGVVSRRRGWRLPALAVMTVGTVFSLAAQMSIGTTMAAYIHRGDSLERFLQWQHDVSPKAQGQLVTQVHGLPVGGDTDQLAIRGDCQALYLNTGDQYQPWIPVQERDRVLELSATGKRLSPGRVILLRVTGTDPQSVRIEVNRHQQLRFVTKYGDAYARGPWFDMPTSGGVRLGIRNLIAIGFFQFESTPGGQAGFLPSVYFDRNQNSLPALLTLTHSSGLLATLGLSMRQLPGLPMPLCQELAHEAGIHLGAG